MEYYLTPENYTLFLIGTVVILLLVAGVLYERNRAMKKKGTVVMSTREAAKIRFEIAQRKLGESITNTIEEMVYQQEITAEDAKRWYKKLGSQGLADLLPGRGDLKRAIRLRLQIHNWEPVSIPGEAPPQVSKKKAFGDKLLNRKKKDVAATAAA